MKICFVTTGDIRRIATSKRALGMAAPLSSSGWEVHILMEDTEENRHRADLECPASVKVHFFPRSTALGEVRIKNRMIRHIRPDFIYLCAFVFRNIVSSPPGCRKLAEHSELQSGIPDIKGFRKLTVLLFEYYSVWYSDGLLSASKYLEDLYCTRAKRTGRSKLPVLYFPYAFSESLHQPVSLGVDHPLNRKYQGKRVFLYLGTITRNYGAFTMIRAFEQLPHLRDQARLVLIGRGRHLEEAKSYILSRKLTDYIELPGFVEEEDIRYYFSVASAFISPMNDTVQDWARCPSKLFMYLPYRKPVLTCRIGEPVTVLNGAAVYYKSGSANDMAHQIENMFIQNKWEADSKPHLHSWNQRTKEFDSWIRSRFNK